MLFLRGRHQPARLDRGGEHHAVKYAATFCKRMVRCLGQLVSALADKTITDLKSHNRKKAGYFSYSAFWIFLRFSQSGSCVLCLGRCGEEQIDLVLLAGNPCHSV